jgi:hypothetical protein
MRENFCCLPECALYDNWIRACTYHPGIHATLDPMYQAFGGLVIPIDSSAFARLCPRCAVRCEPICAFLAFFTTFRNREKFFRVSYFWLAKLLTLK